MIPNFRVWLPDPDVEKMLRVKALVFENDRTRCMCGYAYDFYLEDEDATIMQSTGLKDKNGKEIFEGDILGTKDGLLNGVVEYRSDLGMWINNLIRYNNFERLCNVANSREIIGNVWEEGDLIDGKNTSEN